MNQLGILIPVGLLIGIFGTLIGAGGGFILVPILIFSCPEFSPETVYSNFPGDCSSNAISGSFAYARSGRIDFKAGLIFALFTIPGTILGVLTTKYIPKQFFNLLFGVLLVALSTYLLVNQIRKVSCPNKNRTTGDGNIIL